MILWQAFYVAHGPFGLPDDICAAQQCQVMASMWSKGKLNMQDFLWFRAKAENKDKAVKHDFTKWIALKKAKKKAK